MWKECSFIRITRLPELVTFVGDVDSSEQSRDSLAAPTLYPPDVIQRTEVECASQPDHWFTQVNSYLLTDPIRERSFVPKVIGPQRFLDRNVVYETALHVPISAVSQEDSHSAVGSSGWDEN